MTVAVAVVDEREELVGDPRAKKELEEHHVGDVKHFLRNKNIEPQRSADGKVEGKREKDDAHTKKSKEKVFDKKCPEEADGTD